MRMVFSFFCLSGSILHGSACSNFRHRVACVADPPLVMGQSCLFSSWSVDTMDANRCRLRHRQHFSCARPGVLTSACLGKHIISEICSCVRSVHCQWRRPFSLCFRRVCLHEVTSLEAFSGVVDCFLRCLGGLFGVFWASGGPLRRVSGHLSVVMEASWSVLLIFKAI